jgi:hypothetical protein
VGCVSAGKDHIRRTERNICPICVIDRDLRPGCECDPRLFSERRVDLNRGDLAGGADKLGSNGGVVSGPAAEMEDVFSRHDVEVVEEIGPEARLSVVDAAHLVERNQHVMIDMARLKVNGQSGVDHVQRPLRCQPPERPSS